MHSVMNKKQLTMTRYKDRLQKKDETISINFKKRSKKIEKAETKCKKKQYGEKEKTRKKTNEIKKKRGFIRKQIKQEKDITQIEPKNIIQKTNEYNLTSAGFL